MKRSRHLLLLAFAAFHAATGCVPAATAAPDRAAHATSAAGTAAPAALPAGDVESREQIASGDILWVVDGREVSAALARALDPAGIVAVEVLKGRQAISRFGRRAANGAVIVTTRSRTHLEGTMRG